MDRGYCVCASREASRCVMDASDAEAGYRDVTSRNPRNCPWKEFNIVNEEARSIYKNVGRQEDR
ncbi:uncharacterized protein K460DRAFT_365388 [Cucurbitaria berberidis CBS 394.84]|uniref:Uncharacterized protein n=1 Tax=Cucurbitaria berberidis CBS 394.84 TaxID=1168544 RepID=A0A9P4GPT0_9PLEO|nr:uncharacterized protein K460DRAFT_365388 [Cucurbitaria berberidis CBS 394.84]KAF1849495.1 hypothetical protein K460DRAFT_365388 [Cucurbitaria berberidis CBS 394.84]